MKEERWRQEENLRKEGIGKKARAGREGPDGLDSGDEKQEAKKEDSPDIRQGGWR